MTATCATCGRTLKLPGLKRWFRTPNLDEAQAALGRVNATLSGVDAVEEFTTAIAPEHPDSVADFVADFVAEPLEDEPLARVAGVIRRATGTRAQIDALARELARELGDFTSDEFEVALERAEMDPSRAEKFIEELVKCGVLFEPRAGRYALL